MTDLKITTDSFADDLLLPRRTLRIGEKSIRTPTKTIPVRKTRKHEQVHEASRGINELYREVDSQLLKQARTGASSAINRHLQKGLNKTNSGEVNIVFFSYTDTMTLPVIDAQYLIDTELTTSDILTVPLMPKLAGAVDPNNGLSDSAYRSYKKSVLRFLEQTKGRASTSPVMGVLPPLGWKYLEDLMEVYAAYDIRAYCLNFNRRKITANRQIGMIRPLVQSIAARGIEENVLFYALNLAPGNRDDALGGRPAEDLASVGMGFDIIGGTHVAPQWPQEVFEKIEAEQGEEDEMITFRLFDKEEYLYREIPLDQLPSAFPTDSAFDPDHIAQRVQNSPGNAKYRLQSLVNSEQIALALADLRDVSGPALSHVSIKQGITDQTITAYEDVRNSFDEEFLQTGLGEF